MRILEKSEKRETRVRKNVPKIGTIRGLDRAAEKLTQAVITGEITPAERETMMRVLESRSRILVDAEIDTRFERIEDTIGLKRAA